MAFHPFRRSCAVFLVAGFGLLTGATPPIMAQSVSESNVPLILTASVKGSRPAPELRQDDIAIQLKGRPAEIRSFTPLRGQDAGLQLVFLFDESAPASLSLQFPSIGKFIRSLPPTAEVGIAYMANGRAVFQQTLISDHELAAKALRLPNSIPGVTGSPYFCLSDLAKHWPSDAKVRRVVFMVTNGRDPYYQQADMQDPYLDAAISDSQKARLLVYSIYFHDRGFSGAGSLGTLFGQSYLLKMAQDTGGESYSEAMTTPVSFDPFLEKFRTSLESQYRVEVAASGSGLQRVRVTSKLKNVKIIAPSMVYVGSLEAHGK